MSAFEPRESYRRVFFSERSQALMLNGRIIGPGDTAQLLIEKLTRRLVACEATLREAPANTRKIIGSFAQFVEDGACILGSPLLTNVAAERPTLASCTAIPLSREISPNALRVAEDYYKLNMGSGYNLDHIADPVEAPTLRMCRSAIRPSALSLRPRPRISD